MKVERSKKAQKAADNSKGKNMKNKSKASPKTNAKAVKAATNKKPKRTKKEKKPTDKLADKSTTTKILQGIFGDAQKKILRRYQRKVKEINKLAPKYASMNDKELQEQTEKLKKRLGKLEKQNQAQRALENVRLEKLKAKGKDKTKATKNTPKAQRAKKEKQRKLDDKALDEILPEAFALVREASERKLKMRPFDVQLIGGIALHEGNVAEMKTGEGKTLVATLPVYLNALTGRGVHVVTVNDYLAQRDAGWMGQVYDFLGLSVGVIINEASFIYVDSS